MVSDVWCATHFNNPKISNYAQQFMDQRTARGLRVAAMVASVVFLGSLLLHIRLGFGKEYLYTYGLLILLAVNVHYSARHVRDIKTLHLLGMVMFVISGAALILLAHKTSTFGPGLMATLILLFMALPLIPWGLREATAALSVTYFLITASSLSVAGRFDATTLSTLQFFMVSSGAIALLLVARNVHIRKNDLRARFNLESVKQEMELLSTRDPLTGAWNRRFLENEFGRISKEGFLAGTPLQLGLLDIDNFKRINDTNGHHYGDLVLKTVARVFRENLTGQDFFIRLGGDEFAVLSPEPNLEELVKRCLNHISTDPQLLREGNGNPVTITVGFAAHLGVNDSLAELYKRADGELYTLKRQRQNPPLSGLVEMMEEQV